MAWAHDGGGGPSSSQTQVSPGCEERAEGAGGHCHYDHEHYQHAVEETRTYGGIASEKSIAVGSSQTKAAVRDGGGGRDGPGQEKVPPRPSARRPASWVKWERQELHPIDVHKDDVLRCRLHT